MAFQTSVLPVSRSIQELLRGYEANSRFAEYGNCHCGNHASGVKRDGCPLEGLGPEDTEAFHSYINSNCFWRSQGMVLGIGAVGEHADLAPGFENRPA
jgi:hypothetical protein